MLPTVSHRVSLKARKLPWVGSMAEPTISPGESMYSAKKGLTAKPEGTTLLRSVVLSACPYRCHLL